MGGLRAQVEVQGVRAVVPGFEFFPLSPKVRVWGLGF